MHAPNVPSASKFVVMRCFGHSGPCILLNLEAVAIFPQLLKVRNGMKAVARNVLTRASSIEPGRFVWV
jgi:hypothetical protein